MMRRSEEGAMVEALTFRLTAAKRLLMPLNAEGEKDALSWHGEEE
jgi:hypothetical protein